MIADTSYVLALINPQDAHHEKARRLFVTHQPLAVQQPALAESLQVTHHRARAAGGRMVAREAERVALKLVVETFRMHVTPVEDVESAIRVFRSHPELSFVDACGVADARSAGGLLTFDETQAKLARAL